MASCHASRICPLPLLYFTISSLEIFVIVQSLPVLISIMTSFMDHESEEKFRLTIMNQTKAMENAYRRKGERPQDIPARVQVINRYMMSLLGSQMSSIQSGNGHLMKT